MQLGASDDTWFGRVIDIGAPGPDRGQTGLNQQPETNQP